MKTNKAKVKKLLENLGKLDQTKIPTVNNYGNEAIDMEKFPNVPEVAATIKELEENGVDGNWLFDNGFAAAGMLLGRFLKKTN